MKVTNRKVVTTDTSIKVSKEDLINALNASGDYNIPYTARVWINCEKRDEYDMHDSGFLNIDFKITEDVPEEINATIPF